MLVTDLSRLTKKQTADYERKLTANCQLYGMTVADAIKSGDGRIARIASTLALKDARDRRQAVCRTR